MLKHINSIEKFHSLLSYYISCLEKEDMLSLFFNFRLERKKFHSNIFKKEQFFLHKKEQFEIKKTPEIENIFKNYKLLQRNMPVFYGYPLFMDSNGNVSPVFFVEIFFEEKEDSIIFTKESVIPEFNHYILTKHNYNVEEINKIRLEIEEEDDFSIKLQKITKLLNLDKKTISSELEQKPLIVRSSPQLINKAILYFGGRMGFTKGLVDELQKLKKLSQQQLESTSLGILFNKEKNEIPENKKDLLEVFSLNESQEKAVGNAFSRDISVITGPPGTGKSQVVLNTIANAVYNDKTVLFASKNNRAVDVVNEKLKKILSKDLIIRMGSRKYRNDAKLQINKLFLNKESLNVFGDIRQYNHSIQDCIQKINENRLKINNLSDLNEDIEAIHKKIDKLTNSVPKELHRNFQKDKYLFLINCDIKKDIDKCEHIYSELKRIILKKKHFSNKLDILKEPGKKPKIVFTLLKEIKSIKESEVNEDLQTVIFIDSKRGKLQNDLKEIKKEKEGILNDKKYKKIYELLKSYNSSSINELELKREIILLFERRNIFSFLLEKIFPTHYLNKKFNFLRNTLKTLEKDIRHYIEENTEFNTESIRESLKLILKLKRLSLIEREERNGKAEIATLEKKGRKIINSYFRNKSKSTSVIKENLNYLIFLKKKYDVQNEIKKYKNQERGIKIKDEEIFNRYYIKLSKEAKRYFNSKKKRGTITRQLLSQMKTQEKIVDLYNKIIKINKTLLNSPSIYNLQQKIQTIKEEKIKLSRKIFENYWFEKLKETSPSDENHVSRYIDASKKLEPWIEDKSLWLQLIREQESEIQELLSFLPIWVVTNLSAKNSLPLKENLFDLLIIDEASQCDIASALPLFYRAKQVVIIGDPKQLKHISLLGETEDKKIASENKISELYLDYAYSKNSLYDISERIIKSQNKSPILLNQHYRSYEDIINFSNKYFYEKKLNIMTDESKLIPDSIHPRGVKWIDVCGKMSQTKGLCNNEEAIEIIKILKTFQKPSLKKFSFGIVTLFRAQRELIANKIIKTKELKDVNNITVGTTHRFQGDEKDIILFSPAISSGVKQSTLNWIHDTSQLLNVAITRARSNLTVVGDKKRCYNTGGLLKSLVKYIDSKKDSGFNFDSPVEEKLYKRLNKDKIRVIPQYEIKVRGTKSYRLDFVLFINGNKYDIEIDGNKAHSQKIESDILRDIHLRMEGWKVRRFQASEIYNDINGVVEEIKRLC